YDGPEDLLLGDRRGGRDVREERRREVPALLGRRPRRLEARGARGLALLHQARDLLELDGRDDRADVYRLVERRALAQVLHALAQLRLHARRHALLHEQAAAGAADLALVEPDRVDDALDGGVEVGVLEPDEGRLAAQLQGELQLAARGLAADDAPHLRRARERDLVEALMGDEGRAGAPVAGHDVEDALGQPDLLRQLGEGQRRQRRELGGLQDDRVPGGEGRRDLPRQHQEREVPGDDLAAHAHGLVAGELLLEELRPA